MHSVASKAFSSKSLQDQENLLFAHLKSACSLRYSVDFELIANEKKINVNKKVPRLNIDSTKFHRNTPKTTRKASTKPNSTTNLKSSSFLFRNPSRKESIEKKHNSHAFSIITPRGINIDKTSAMSSPKLRLTERNTKKGLKVVTSFVKPQKNKTESSKLTKIIQLLKKYKQRENTEYVELSVKAIKCIRLLGYIERKNQTSKMHLRLSYRLWSLITKKNKILNVI